MQSFINRRGHETGMGRQQNRYGVDKARAIQRQTWSASSEQYPKGHSKDAGQAEIRQDDITGRDQDTGKQTMNKAKLDLENSEWLCKVAIADTVINAKQYLSVWEGSEWV